MATTYSPGQVYQEVLTQGGSTQQAQVAAALVSGIESNGQLNDQNPTSTASGLFQFLDTTWDNYGGVSHAGNASFQQQVAKFISESAGNNFYAWAPDLGGTYNGSGTLTTIAPGSKVGQFLAANPTISGEASGLASLTPAEGQSLKAAVAAGGGSYLSALNAQNQTAANSSTASSGVPGDTSASGSAISLIDTTLQQYGLGDLSNWAWTELTNGKNSDQIMLDLQNQPAYVNSIFGQTNKARVANGLAPMTPTQILSYKDTAQTAAQAAGLPQGFLDTGTLVNLMGNDVSATELTQRITSGYAAAMAAPQETRDLLHQYFGVDTGNLAAYYLDPTKAEDLLKNQLVAAEVGTQAAQSGFGQLNATQAQQLTSELAAKGQINPSGSGTWDVNVGSTFAQLAPLAQLEQQMPGMGASAPAVSQNDLLGYGFLSRGQATVQNALETRRAFASGGGGEDVGSQGVIGAGNAPSEGNKQAGQSYG